MKKLFLLVVITALFLPGVAFGRGQNVHHDVNPPYDCQVTSAPKPIKWIKKADKSGNKQLRLKWYDSEDAHDIEMEFNGKTYTIPDDGLQTMKKLKKNKKYQVRMRGVSNCWTGEWTRVYSFKA